MIILGEEWFIDVSDILEVLFGSLLNFSRYRDSIIYEMVWVFLFWIIKWGFLFYKNMLFYSINSIYFIERESKECMLLKVKVWINKRVVVVLCLEGGVWLNLLYGVV